MSLGTKLLLSLGIKSATPARHAAGEKPAAAKTALRFGVRRPKPAPMKVRRPGLGGFRRSVVRFKARAETWAWRRERRLVVARRDWMTRAERRRQFTLTTDAPRSKGRQARKLRRQLRRAMARRAA